MVREGLPEKGRFKQRPERSGGAAMGKTSLAGTRPPGLPHMVCSGTCQRPVYLEPRGPEGKRGERWGREARALGRDSGDSQCRGLWADFEAGAGVLVLETQCGGSARPWVDAFFPQNAFLKGELKARVGRPRRTFLRIARLFSPKVVMVYRPSVLCGCPSFIFFPTWIVASFENIEKFRGVKWCLVIVSIDIS